MICEKSLLSNIPKHLMDRGWKDGRLQAIDHSVLDSFKLKIINKHDLIQESFRSIVFLVY